MDYCKKASEDVSRRSAGKRRIGQSPGPRRLNGFSTQPEVVWRPSACYVTVLRQLPAALARNRRKHATFALPVRPIALRRTPGPKPRQRDPGGAGRRSTRSLL